MQKSRKLALACGLALAALRAPAVAQDNRDLLKRSVVKIVAQKGSASESTATGFLVGQRDERLFYVVTACHAISGAQRISMWFESNRQRALPARPVGECSITPVDVGVLVVDTPDGRSLMQHTVAYQTRDLDVRLGETVHTLGHPNDLEWYSEKHTVNLETDPGRTATFRVTRGEIAEGSSGGPVFDEEGALAGMVASTTATLALVVKIGPLLEKLRQSDVPLNMTRAAVSGASVVLSDSLRLSLDSTDIRNTIASEIAAALKGSRYSLVYKKPEELRQYTPSSADELIFEGEAVADAFRLTAAMVITETRVIRLLEQIERPDDPGPPSAPKLIVPAKRFFRNQFLFSHYRVELNIPARYPPEVRAAMARLAIQYTFGVAYFFGGDSQARRWFGEAINTAKLLPAMEAPALGRICRALSYYLTFGERNPAAAVEMLDLAARFGPTEPDHDIIRAYLLIVSGNTDAAEVALDRLTARADDPAQPLALKGAYRLARHDYDAAIPLLKEALPLERESYYQAKLHLALALAYGAKDGISQPDRAASVLFHASASVKNTPDSVPAHALEAFGAAIGGDAKAARASLEQVYRLDKAAKPEAFDEGGLFEEWFHKSFLNLPEAGRSELIAMAGDPSASLDPKLLATVGGALRAAGQPEKAAPYIERAYALNPRDPGICELKAVAVLSEGEDRARLEKARDLLTEALDTGGPTTSRHRMLAAIYQSLGDEAQENEHNRIACELSPNMPQCFTWRGELAVRASDFATAKREFAAARARKPDDADVRSEEGIAWQKAGRFAEALDAYLEALRIDPDNYSPNDNAGFVLFELDRFQEALAHFEAALKIHPDDADPLAGKAITLQALGRRDAAIEALRRAVAADSRVLDPTYLRKDLMWTDKAVRALASLRSGAGLPR